jgi:hypothetical protein
MDPGTALAVVSLGIQVFQGLVSYYDAWKSYDADIAHTHRSLTNNLKTLQVLQHAALSNPINKSTDIEQVETAVLSCKDGLLSLQKKLTKIKPCDVSGGWPSVRAFGRRALREIVEDLKDDLTLAVQVLQM